MSDSSHQSGHRLLRKTRFAVARAAGQFTRLLLKFVGRNATTLPGLVATTLEPEFLTIAAANLRATLVSGTNGKTTTSNLLAFILRSAGQESLITNAAGSNLTRGIASAVLQRKTEHAPAVFEVDEANLLEINRQLRPKLVVLLNLFRDQMDRYGELDRTARDWQLLFSQTEDIDFLLNADDPNLGWLGHQHNRAEFFGVATDQTTNKKTVKLSHTADAIISPISGQLLVYREVFFSHLGDYHDPKSTFTRPPLDYAIHSLKLKGIAGSTFDIRDKTGATILHLRTVLPGMYNVYNVTAAAVAALKLGIAATTIEASVSKFPGVFGRFEVVELAPGRRLIIALVKNPTGFNQVLEFLAAALSVPFELAIGINDRLADGTDVSWLWDVDIDLIPPLAGSILTSGTRAHEVALRLHYSEVAQPVRPLPDIPQLLNELVSGSGRLTVCCLSYTAMLEFRSLLVKRGFVKPSM